MTHSEAEQSYAVERYLLGEMPPQELDEFEQHYFECAICGDEVKAGAAFTANLPPVLAEQPAPVAAPVAVAKPRWWEAWQMPRWSWAPMALAACALVAIVVVYLRPDRPVETAAVYRVSMERAGDVPRLTPSDIRFQVAHEWPQQFGQYQVEVTQPGGAIAQRFELAGTSGDLEFVVRAGTLERGKIYWLIVKGISNAGGEPAIVSRTAFEVKQ